MEGYFRGRWSHEYESLKYIAGDGKLSFEFRQCVAVPTEFHAGSYRQYRLIEDIPSEVLTLGKDSIKNYVKKRIDAYLSERKSKDERWDNYVKNMNVPIQVEYDGLILCGKVFSAYDTALKVRLLEPFTGESFVIFGFGSAMAGHRIFKKDTGFPPELSDYGLDAAHRLLVQIYKREKQARTEVGKLARELNIDIKK